ncbi:stage V sporulation protein S [Paenibacillus pectinilyticus]|uniref:Stage V sporulation protein S n=1 Tax=Paenibacillus pectinilyticus TaxID=512399 RepID=A0A1C0ZTZ7_9BACL|nr:lasso peptide biosynthesis B2 protein [Paenibacillus pectinilyticus]OCT11548.1 stage V sporulation protein S [Paenibacillus pectinilyticus]
MRFVRILKLICSLDMTTMLLFLEAYTFLGWARILKSIRFTKVIDMFGLQMDETSISPLHIDRRKVSSVASAIQTMSRYTPWDSKCLVRALAAMKMLERRKIDSTLYLGTAKDETGSMIAHAWLRSGPYYVSGAEEMKRFTVVGTFAKKAI